MKMLSDVHKRLKKREISPPLFTNDIHSLQVPLVEGGGTVVFSHFKSLFNFAT